MSEVEAIDIALESYVDKKKYFENYLEIAKKSKIFLRKRTSELKL